MARSLISFALLIRYFILAGSRVEASGLYEITRLDPGTSHGLFLDGSRWIPGCFFLSAPQGRPSVACLLPTLPLQ
jgi:hypothetical protein